MSSLKHSAKRAAAATAFATALSVGSAGTVVLPAHTVATAQSQSPESQSSVNLSSDDTSSATSSAQLSSSGIATDIRDFFVRLFNALGLGKVIEFFEGLTSSLSSTRNPDRQSSIPKTANSISEGLAVTLIGDLLGPEVRKLIGVGAVDLGIMAPIGTGKEFAVVFGDSFTGSRFGAGEWISPVGVVAEKDADGTIRIKRRLNDGAKAAPLIGNYEHTDMLTLIPSDVINIDGILYMQGMWNKGIGNVTGTEIWASADNGRTWSSIWQGDQFYLRGMGNLISWELGPDGYVYVVSSQFKRQDPVYLSRFRPADIANRDRWESFDPTTNSWGGTAKPILRNNVKAGEMNLRYIDGHWVLVMFNAASASIEIRVSKDIAREWDSIKPAHAVIAGKGGWARKQSPENFTQLYGGYIAPGSTLDNMDIVVSQWNTSNNSRYMSTQFNVKGVDKFFGITPQPAALGNQDVVDVVEEVTVEK